MNIMGIGANTNSTPNFKAVVNISAKPTLLDEKAINELKEIGKKIGDKDTKIDMFVDYNKHNQYVYNFRHKTELNFKENFKAEKLTFETNEDVLSPTLKPLDYGKRLLGRIKTFVNINTLMQ